MQPITTKNACSYFYFSNTMGPFWILNLTSLPVLDHNDLIHLVNHLCGCLSKQKLPSYSYALYIFCRSKMLERYDCPQIFCYLHQKDQLIGKHSRNVMMTKSSYFAIEHKLGIDCGPIHACQMPCGGTFPVLMALLSNWHADLIFTQINNQPSCLGPN